MVSQNGSCVLDSEQVSLQLEALRLKVKSAVPNTVAVRHD